MLEEEMSRQIEVTEQMDQFLARLKKYDGLKELDANVLNGLIKTVKVHAPDKVNGHRQQRVEIYFDPIGVIPETLLWTILQSQR